jgi:hypothetical protein
MKYQIPVILSLAFAVVGFYGGTQYEMLKQTYRAEAVIGKEVTILERYKGIPDCTRAKNAVDQQNTEKSNGAIVIWSYNQAKDLLKREIIMQDFSSAFEEVAGYCTTGTENKNLQYAD